MSIARSALNEEKQVRKKVEEGKNELLQRVNELETELEEAQASHSEEQEQLLQAKEEEMTSQTELVDMLQSQSRRCNTPDGRVKPATFGLLSNRSLNRSMRMKN